MKNVTTCQLLALCHVLTLRFTDFQFENYSKIIIFVILNFLAILGVGCAIRFSKLWPNFRPGPGCIKKLKIKWEFLELFSVFLGIFRSVVVFLILFIPLSANLSIIAFKKILRNTGNGCTNSHLILTVCNWVLIFKSRRNRSVGLRAFLIIIYILFFNCCSGPEKLSESLTFVYEVSTFWIAKVFKKVFCYINTSNHLSHVRVSAVFLAREFVRGFIQ